MVKELSTFAVWFHKDGKDYQGTVSLYQEDGSVLEAFLESSECQCLYPNVEMRIHRSIVDYQVQWEQNPFSSDEEAQVWERHVLEVIRTMEDDCARCLHFKGTKTTIRRSE